MNLCGCWRSGGVIFVAQVALAFHRGRDLVWISRDERLGLLL
jgi:hypothetical protein